MNAEAGIVRSLRTRGDKDRARRVSQYFQVTPGGYGYGDTFLGVPMPVVRTIARQYRSASLVSLEKLLDSRFHEARMCSLIILCHQAERGNRTTASRILRMYLKQRRMINNWDLIDTSAPTIVGPFLTRARGESLIRSRRVWDRRIALLATQFQIRERRFGLALHLLRHVLDDHEDLIQKAAGWMLREIGNRDRNVLRMFLDRHHHAMPRTMLRYAIEKLPGPMRRSYMSRSGS